MAKIQKNDEETKRILFEKFHDQVYRKAYFITKDHYLAQDVLQETFLKAYNHMDQLKNDESIGAWLSVIATRTAVDLIRKQKRSSGIPMENSLLEDEIFQQTSSSSVESEMEQEWLKENLRSVINELPTNFRAVIILKYGHDLKEQEIAKILGENIGTVKSRIYRAKNKLKSLLLSSDTMDGDSL